MARTVRILGGTDPATVLRSSGLVDDLGEEELQRLSELLVPHELKAGGVLFEQGAPGETLYLVRRGRLRVERSTDAGRVVVGEVGPGSCVGEMALLSGEPRSATVWATRDTALLGMKRATLERLVQSSPRTGLMLARVVIERAAQWKAPQDPGDWSFALACAEEDPALEAAADAWLETMRRRSRALVLDRIDPSRPPDLDHLEVLAEHLVFDLRRMDDPEARDWALRQSDRVVVFERDPVSRDPSREREIIEHTRDNVPLDHVLTAAPPPGRTWPVYGQGGFAYQRYRVDGSQASLDRVVRNQTATAIGMALSGGALRGIGHVGVYQAWQESGFVIDRLAGTSAGAMAAACIAAGVDVPGMREGLERFMRASKVQEMGPPFVSLMSGKLIADHLAATLSDLRIEDTPIPVHIVCADLVGARPVAAPAGSLRLLVRASSSLPGVWPPVPFGDALLVDGGLVDNLPASRLLPWAADGFVAAVDISSHFTPAAIDPSAHTVSGWALLRDRLKSWIARRFGVERPRALPNLSAIDTIVRSSTLASQEVFRRNLDTIADLTLRPELPDSALARIASPGAIGEVIESARESTLRVIDTLPEERRRQLAGEPIRPDP